MSDLFPSFASLDLADLTPDERERFERRVRELSEPGAFARAVTTLNPIAGAVAGTNAEKIRARRARDSFYEFVKLIWHVVEPGLPFLETPHVRAICDHCQAVAEGRISRLLINIPPGHAKSLL